MLVSLPLIIGVLSVLHQAELVAMVLRWLPEDITVHNEDLEGSIRFSFGNKF